MKKTILLSLVSVLSFSVLAAETKNPAPVPAPAPAPKPPTAAELATVPKIYDCKDGSVFRYRWHEPTQTESGKWYPLVILMHGSGERGTNNVAQLALGANQVVNWFKAKKQEYYLVVGQVPNNDMWTPLKTVAGSQPLSEKPTPSMARQIEFLEQLFMGDLPIDRTRIYVGGCSMGGYGTWDIISRRPYWFAAAMPVCGGGDPRQAPKLRELPIFIHHGDADGNVAPWNSRLMYSALVMAGSNCVRYREYPNCGHASWNPAFGDTANLDWFFAQRRPACPAWQQAVVEKTPEGTLKVVPPAPRYEIEFDLSLSGEKPAKIVGRRAGTFPTVLVDGRVVEGVAFVLQLTGNQVLLGNRKDGRTFDFANIRIRALAKEER